MRNRFLMCFLYSLFWLLFLGESTKAQHPIIVENNKPGTKDWILDKIRADTCRLLKPYSANLFCRQQDIEGYCSKTSIKNSETLEVFVSTNPESPFTVDIYRMGYYGGKGGRKMLSLGNVNGHTQRTPPDGKKNLRDCNWKKSFEIKIPNDWISGVYIGKMTAKISGMQSYIVFIVKDDRKTDFLFQCSDFTWQNYNRWPEWRSGYDWHYENGGHNPWNSDPGPEISFNRPYTFYFNGLPVGVGDPRFVGSGEFLMWEFPLAYWMESKGYDVSYISNLDVHTNSRELLRAKGFLSVGHDEYWTRRMYDNVSVARDSGVSLLFLSGNAISGVVYLKPDGKGMPNRVIGRIERYKDEEKLLGAKSYGVGLGDWTCDAPEHWLFAGTGMKKGDFIKDLVGWEYHGYPLGKQPGIKVLATGPMVSREDSTDYAATIYEMPKGNFVFDAATCWWNMSLSTPPLYQEKLNPNGAYHGHPVNFSEGDFRVQKMTENLFNRVINK
ncbi:MAG: N,N-dimethylformamidase beta subunit family domain-containing protein [Ginsengibacter sp.]